MVKRADVLVRSAHPRVDCVVHSERHTRRRHVRPNLREEYTESNHASARGLSAHVWAGDDLHVGGEKCQA